MAKNVVIIGGGASGLMAAIWASRLGAAVTVLEKNDKPGRKLLATGNGRCNFTDVYKRQIWRSRTRLKILSRITIRENRR